MLAALGKHVFVERFHGRMLTWKGEHATQPFATQLLADGYDIRTVQELFGRQDVRTTMIDTHVFNRGGRGVRSPADGLARLPDER